MSHDPQTTIRTLWRRHWKAYGQWSAAWERRGSPMPYEAPAFYATKPVFPERWLQELLQDDGARTPDDPVMQELAPLVAAVHTLPSAIRHQLVQLWQATLQLVQGGSGPPPSPSTASAAEASDYATAPYY